MIARKLTPDLLREAWAAGKQLPAERQRWVRNQVLCTMHESGLVSIPVLAVAFGVSRERIYSILRTAKAGEQGADPDGH